MYLQGYASDCKAALRNVLAREFPYAIAFVCAVHGKKNISEKCRELGLSTALSSKICADIFGSGGLIYAKNREEYETTYLNVRNQWMQLEEAEKQHPQFVSYFERNKKEEIFDHMRVRVSIDAGFKKQIVTTNPIESLNAVIKRWNNFQPTDMSSFLEDVKQLIKEQQENVKRAFLNMPGPYVVRAEYIKHKQLDYFTQSSQDRLGIMESVGRIRIDKKRYSQVVKHKTSAAMSGAVCDDDNSDVIQRSSSSYLVSKEPDDPFNTLLTLFCRSDLDALKSKARSIVDKKEILQGFATNQYIG